MSSRTIRPFLLSLSGVLALFSVATHGTAAVSADVVSSVYFTSASSGDNLRRQVSNRVGGRIEFEYRGPIPSGLYPYFVLERGSSSGWNRIDAEYGRQFDVPFHALRANASYGYRVRVLAVGRKRSAQVAWASFKVRGL